MLTSLWLPILLTTAALFFASFLSWMVLPLHRRDWLKLDNEDGFLEAMQSLDVPAGSYTFPGVDSPQEMQRDEFKQKFERGPVGILTVYAGVSMGRNLGLTVLYFFCCNFCLAYLSTLALEAGAPFMDVFRFVATAGLMTFLPAILQHAIWFRNRIVGHVLESIGYAVIAGAIFGALWPAAS